MYLIATFAVLQLMTMVVRATINPYHYQNPGQLDVYSFSDSRHQMLAQKLVNKIVPSSSIPSQSKSHVVNPTSFGADPTGVNDSTVQLQAAVDFLVNFGTTKDAQGRINLGGAVLDLDGGIFSISDTILFPPGYSSFSIYHGSLIARSNFTSAAGSYLLQIGSLGKCTSTSGGSNNKNCNSDISITEVTIDGRQFAFGGLSVWDSMNINIGPSLYVVGYVGVGVSLQGSGAGFIHESWFGQFPPGSPKPIVSTGTAILLNSGQHDCDIFNIIIFSGLVGVNTTNGANRLQGVHTWNLAGSHGGTGIRLHKGSGRVNNCYLDYAPLVIGIEDYQNENKKYVIGNDIAIVEGNLFLGSSTMVLEAGHKNTIVSNLIVTGNIFHSNNVINATVILDESNGNKFINVENMIMENNEVGQKMESSGKKLSTRATDTAALLIGTKNITINFDQPLIFSSSIGIDPLSVKCFLHGEFATAISTSVNGNEVTIHLSEVVPSWVNYSSVTCSVDQSRRRSPAH